MRLSSRFSMFVHSSVVGTELSGLPSLYTLFDLIPRMVTRQPSSFSRIIVNTSHLSQYPRFLSSFLLVEVHLIYNEKHGSWLSTLMNFDSCTHCVAAMYSKIENISNIPEHPFIFLSSPFPFLPQPTTF